MKKLFVMFGMVMVMVAMAGCNANEAPIPEIENEGTEKTIAEEVITEEVEEENVITWEEAEVTFENVEDTFDDISEDETKVEDEPKSEGYWCDGLNINDFDVEFIEVDKGDNENIGWVSVDQYIVFDEDGNVLRATRQIQEDYEMNH